MSRKRYYDPSNKPLKGVYSKEIEPYKTRLENMTKLYGGIDMDRSERQGWVAFKWAVLKCYFRQKISIQDIANILGAEEQEVEWAIDTIKQDAQ